VSLQKFWTKPLNYGLVLLSLYELFEALKWWLRRLSMEGQKSLRIY